MAPQLSPSNGKAYFQSLDLVCTPVPESSKKSFGGDTGALMALRSLSLQEQDHFGLPSSPALTQSPPFTGLIFSQLDMQQAVLKNGSFEAASVAT